MDEITDWLLGWFGKSTDFSIESLRLHISANYFDLGLIDSLGVITLIAEIEEQFEIEFSADNFQERRFATITGLSEIIAELRK